MQNSQSISKDAVPEVVDLRESVSTPKSTNPLRLSAYPLNVPQPPQVSNIPSALNLSTKENVSPTNNDKENSSIPPSDKNNVFHNSCVNSDQTLVKSTDIKPPVISENESDFENNLNNESGVIDLSMSSKKDTSDDLNSSIVSPKQCNQTTLIIPSPASRVFLGQS